MYVLQVVIAANHQNGKDTHVRGLAILGPKEYVEALVCNLSHHFANAYDHRLPYTDEETIPFKNYLFKMHEYIR